MYALDLKRPLQMVAPKVAVTCSVRESPVAIDLIGESMCEERYAKGDRVIVAYIKQNPVAYLFAATTNTWVGEIEDWLDIPQGEVYLYDAYTAGDYRGMRIYPFLMCTAARYYKRKAYRFVMIYSEAHNIDSIKGIERCGFQCYGVVDYRNFFGLKSWCYGTGDRYVKARFRNED
jgi:ribosomal protein S18 acetylase RimI-like enzyme